MKAKQIKRSILAILMIAVFMVGTSVVSVGAATQKTYLNTMGYSSFNTDCERNAASPYYGEDYHDNECTNAYQFYIHSDRYEYPNPDELYHIGYVSYTVTFNLNKRYDDFNFSLTAGKIGVGSVKLSILGDGNYLYGSGVTEDTNQIPVSINVKDVNVITFELKSPISGAYMCENYVILNNAYFTSEGATPEPTTKVPDTTQKPTQAPTKPVENPTTVAPTTKNPVVTPTKDVEDTTTATKVTSSSGETTSSKINPTASTNATSKISTSDTATRDGANKGIANISNNKGNSDNGTIQTGAVSIAVVLFVILASLATGGFVWYRRKIK